METQKEVIRDARKLGVPKMLLLGLQHMFAMFGATILVPILVNVYFEGDTAERNGLPTVRYFADKLCLSSNYFGDMFKKETGKTPQEYIQEKIIGLAKEMVAGTDETVSHIAYSLGFQYPQHFCRLFKRRVGCTPNEYRSQASAHCGMRCG